jgi:hypothetical protein
MSTSKSMTPTLIVVPACPCLSLSGNTVHTQDLTQSGSAQSYFVAVIAMIVTSGCQSVEDLPVRIGLQ